MRKSEAAEALWSLSKSREGFYDLELISAHPGGDPAKFPELFRRRLQGSPGGAKMGAKSWTLQKKWTRQGLRWLRIDPKSHGI